MRLSLVAMLLVGALPVLAAPPLPQTPFSADRATEIQEAWAKSLGVPREIVNSIDMKLVLIPPGRFTMGANGSTYRVTLAKPFYIGVTEVTLGHYRRWNSRHSIEGSAAEFNDDARPAAMVNWEDAQAFCQWLSDRPEEKRAGRIYALPSEAQWEWAARAGTSTARYFGDTDKSQSEYSWFNHTYTPNPKHETGDRGRQAVGKLKPNAWGLHDMLGNVWEWCGDRRTDEATGEARDPVMRGGSWRSGAFHCTAVAHDPGAPKLKADHVGFRVVCGVARK
jgi:formylglycine-generating enzyme required for sulfatase activity